MAIKAIKPYYGGKRTLAPVIIRQLGDHRGYWEPFCGSMAVLMAKDPAPMEVANDLYGSVINLARVLASDRAVDLYERVERTLIHEDLVKEAWDRVGLVPDESMIAPTVRVADEAGNVIFADPPYLRKTKAYLHDFTPDDHVRLEAALRSKKRARVVVSYYDGPTGWPEGMPQHLRELYREEDGWRFIDCTMVKNLANQRKSGAPAAVAPEVLIVNGEVYGEVGGAGLFG